MPRTQLQTSELGTTGLEITHRGAIGGGGWEFGWGPRTTRTRSAEAAGRADEMRSIARALGYGQRDLAAIFDVLDRMTAHQSVAQNSC